MALDAGADDYVRKPFGADELRARVRAVLRRTNVAGPITEALHAGRLFIDGARQCVRLDGEDLELSATEFALLGQLVRHQDRVLSHEELLAAVWGRERADSRQLLRVTMSRLRLKLKRCGCDLIRTLPRVGYRLQAGGQAA
jgi:two-component system KDP operon response regulator KdpE